MRAKWALVGLGRHAEQYVAPAIRASALGELVAVCSSDGRRAQEFAANAGGARVYASLDELLRDQDAEFVYLCSANYAHEEQAVRVAGASRHVFCEKPLASSVAACERMVAACARAGVQLGVGYHLRQGPAHQEARRLIFDGAIGRVLSARIQYFHVVAPSGEPPKPKWRLDPALGGGEFIGTGNHALDLARYLLGDDVAAVKAAALRAAGDEQGQAVTVSARMQSGALVSIEFGRAKHAENAAAVVGSNGTIVLRDSIGNFSGGTLLLMTDAGTSTRSWPRLDAYAAQVDDFVSAVRSGSRPAADGIDGVRVAEIVAAAEASVASGCEVSLAGLPDSKG